VSDSESRNRRHKGQARFPSRRAYSGRIINLDVDRVRFPNGLIGELEMIRHPVPAPCSIHIGARSRTRDSCLSSSTRTLPSAFLYEYRRADWIRAGTRRWLARRELKEERATRLARSSTYSPCSRRPGFTTNRYTCFSHTDSSRGDTAHEPDEFHEPRTVTMREAVELVPRGASSMRRPRSPFSSPTSSVAADGNGRARGVSKERQRRYESLVIVRWEYSSRRVEFPGGPPGRLNYFSTTA
jgi:ADP-ribose pyrophosphatase